MTDTRTVTTTSTAGLLAMARDAEGRNRSAHLDRLRRHIDPEGVHLCVFTLLHNDVELRTCWWVKVTGTDDPVTLWLDVSFKTFDKWIEAMQIPVQEGE